MMFFQDTLPIARQLQDPILQPCAELQLQLHTIYWGVHSKNTNLYWLEAEEKKNAINKTAQDEPAGTDMGAVGSTHILKFYYFSFSEVLEYNLELPLLFKVHLKIISLHSKLSEL